MLTEQQPKIRILIVDDHQLTRLSLKLLLSQYSDLEVIGLASNGQEAIEKVQQSRPDVMLLDLQMPVLNGLSAAGKIKQFAPQTRIVAYTSLEDPQTEVISHTAPIDRFCQKDIPIEQLLKIINDLGRRSPAFRDTSRRQKPRQYSTTP